MTPPQLSDVAKGRGTLSSTGAVKIIAPSKIVHATGAVEIDMRPEIVDEEDGRAPKYIGSAMSGPWPANPRVRRVRHGGYGRPSRAAETLFQSAVISRCKKLRANNSTSRRIFGKINF
jgi:hypothetical protein